MVDVHAPLTWNARATRTLWRADEVAWAQARLGREFVGADDFARLRVGGEVQDGPVPGNRLVTVGLNNLTARLITATQVWSASSGGAPGAGSGFVVIAVGNGTTGDAIGNTDLSGASKSYRVCDDSYPTQSNGVLVAKASFQSAEANFDWEEYGICVPGSSASSVSGTAAASSKPLNYVLLNRKAPAGLGAKSSGNVASLQITITIT